MKLTLDALPIAPSIKDRMLGMLRLQLRRPAIFKLFTQLLWLLAYAVLIWLLPLHTLGKARSRTAWLHMPC